MRKKRKPYSPACDFQAGEVVWFPIIQPTSGRVKYKSGIVHSVHDAAFARSRGNYVNVVVVRNDTHYPTHSNLLRKTKEQL